MQPHSYLIGADTTLGRASVGFRLRPPVLMFLRVQETRHQESTLEEKWLADVPAAEANEEAISFGPFCLYTERRKLTCRGEEVPIGRRAMEVLLVLARRGGQIVSKEELFAAAWPNLFVHEDNLKVTISALRRALRSFCPEESYIATVVNQGYRFIVDPEPAASGLDPNLSELNV